MNDNFKPTNLIPFGRNNREADAPEAQIEGADKLILPEEAYRALTVTAEAVNNVRMSKPIEEQNVRAA